MGQIQSGRVWHSRDRDTQAVDTYCGCGGVVALGKLMSTSLAAICEPGEDQCNERNEQTADRYVVRISRALSVTYIALQSAVRQDGFHEWLNLAARQSCAVN